MVRTISLVSVLSLSLAAACSDDIETEPPNQRLDLRTAIGTTDVDAIAVTTTPDGSQTFVFDQATGIYEISSNGEATLVLDINQMPDPGIEVRLPYTDLVALGDDKFALTAIGDGFLLDLANQTMNLHFCYEPDFLPEDFVQRTDAVTYDPGLDKIIAQPQTFNEQGEVVSSDIGYYNRESGFDENWYPLNINFAAGGMAVDANGDLFLGEGSKLFRYNKSENIAIQVDDLGRFGVTRIDGLSFDSVSGELLVVDGDRDELIRVF